MNNRINELMVKAGIELKARRPYIDEEPDGYLESDNDFILNNHDTIIRLLEEGGLEKFAELIVKECIKVGQQSFLKDNSTVPVFPAKQIKQHFGVENA